MKDVRKRGKSETRGNASLALGMDAPASLHGLAGTTFCEQAHKIWLTKLKTIDHAECSVNDNRLQRYKT